MSGLKQFITVNKEVCLQVPAFPTVTTYITMAEDDIFWTGLPRNGNQVLVLQEKQKLSMRIATPLGVCIADTTVESIGVDHDRFYGLAIPEKYLITEQRKFVRAQYAVNVFLQAGRLEAQTRLINFSAGGVMVYMVPELIKILQRKKSITIFFSAENIPYIIDVRNVWVNSYNKVDYSGFQFYDIPSDLQEKIGLLAIKYSPPL